MKIIFEILMFCSMFAAYIFGKNIAFHTTPTTSTLFFISVISFITLAFISDRQ